MKRLTIRITNIVFIALFLGPFILQMELSPSTDASFYEKTTIKKDIPRLIGSGEDIIYREITIIADKGENHSISPINPDSSVELENELLKMAVSETLVDHDPISINGNTDFIIQATTEEWTGNGTLSNPYIIENYLIENQTGSLIEIINTDIFFEISNNSLDGINWNYKGIFLTNVTHGTINGNIINNSIQGISLVSNSNNNLITGNSINFHNEGIVLSSSTTNVISNNTFSHNIYGIYLWNSNYNTILNNAVYENYDGIKLISSDDNQISNNNIHDNEGNGIWLEDADNSIVEDNLIHNSGIITNAKNGIFLSSNSGNNTISGNDVSNSSFSGIRLNDSTFNATITENYLYNNSRFGIWVDNVANSINFVNNTISNNYDYGLAFDSATSNNYVTRNRFINNTQLMTSQAWDVGSENKFFSNYWNEWIIPDLNLDGIVDRPYLIDGSSNNQDLFPLVYGNDTFDLVYQDLTLNQNESFTIDSGEILIFNQCIVPINNYIEFSGEGTLKIFDSDFYHLIIGGNLKVQVICSIIAYTEISGQSLARYENVILQQFFASDNATSILIDCAAMKFYDGSPIPDSISSSTLVVAAHFSRIIMAPYFNFGMWWGKAPASIIWKISQSTYDKTDSLVSLKGVVDFEFYIEGFNPHPTTNSKNISIHFYVGEILEEIIHCVSNPENFTWKINLQFNTSKYSNDVYWLKVVISDSTIENRIVFPFFINNVDHIISEPTVVYPNGGETLSGDVTIQWRAATDSLFHPISYSLLYSSNAGNNWTIIDSGLTLTNYIWDTTTAVFGPDYLIRIIATCSSGLSTDDISNDVFMIIDIQTTTNPTTATEPTTTEHPTMTIPTITPSFTIFPLLINLLILLPFSRRLRK